MINGQKGSFHIKKATKNQNLQNLSNKSIDNQKPSAKNKCPSKTKIQHIIQFQRELGVDVDSPSNQEQECSEHINMLFNSSDHKFINKIKVSNFNENTVRKVPGKVKQLENHVLKENMSVSDLTETIFDLVLDTPFISNISSKQCQTMVNHFLHQCQNYGPIDQIVLASDILLFLAHDTLSAPIWYFNSFCSMGHLIYIKNIDEVTSTKLNSLLNKYQLESIFELKACIGIKLYGTQKWFINNYSNIFYIIMDRPVTLNALYKRFKCADSKLLNQVMEYLASYPSFCNTYLNTIMNSTAHSEQKINLFALHFIKYLDQSLVRDQILDKHNQKDPNYDVLVLVLLNFCQNPHIQAKLNALLLSKRLEEGDQNIAKIITIGYINRLELSKNMLKKTLTAIAILLEIQKMEQLFTESQFSQLIKIYVNVRQQIE